MIDNAGLLHCIIAVILKGCWAHTKLNPNVLYILQRWIESSPIEKVVIRIVKDGFQMKSDKTTVFHLSESFVVGRANVEGSHEYMRMNCIGHFKTLTYLNTFKLAEKDEMFRMKTTNRLNRFSKSLHHSTY